MTDEVYQPFVLDRPRDTQRLSAEDADYADDCRRRREPSLSHGTAIVHAVWPAWGQGDAAARRSGAAPSLVGCIRSFGGSLLLLEFDPQ